MDADELEQMSELETEKKVSSLRKRILTLEWDKENNQLNAGMLRQYEEMKKEYDRLNERLRSIKTSGGD